MVMMCVVLSSFDFVYCYRLYFVFFFKQKTAYEMRISDWSSYVCSSDLAGQLYHLGRRQGWRRRLRQGRRQGRPGGGRRRHRAAIYGYGDGRRKTGADRQPPDRFHRQDDGERVLRLLRPGRLGRCRTGGGARLKQLRQEVRSAEQTYEIQ